MQTSLIIGGNRGIGSVVASSLKKRGDNVYTASRKSSEEKNHITFDVSKDCSNVFDDITNLNNLIFTHRYRGDDWKETFNVTVEGVIKVIQATISKFVKGGSVVVISSNASQFIVSGQPAEYHSSRSALESLMRHCAVHYGNQGIRFNSILPATLIKPENIDFFVDGNEVKEMIEKITPLARMGEATDVANLIEFLCSEKSSFITGNSFFLDGGVSLLGQETIARYLLDMEPK